MSKTVKRDRQRFRRLLDMANERYECGDMEGALYFARKSAHLAWHNGFRWRSEQLEVLLGKVGKSILDDRVPPSSADPDDNTSVGYLATVLSDQGGHSESLHQSIKMLRGSNNVAEQRIYVTHSRGGTTEFPELRERLNEENVPIDELNGDDSLTNRVRDLAERIRQSKNDRLILFIDPSDVVAVATLAGLEHRPRTIFYNHADHVFWIGQNVTDEHIGLRSEGVVLTEKYRNQNISALVPLTTDTSTTRSNPDELHFDGDPTISLTIGAFHKLDSFDGPDYARIVHEILEKTDNHEHVLITTEDVTPREFLPTPDYADRFHSIGPVSDPTPYYSAADILIDTVPFGGSMTRLEAMACKTAVAAFVNPEYPFLGNNDILPQTYDYVARSGDEMSANAITLIQDEEQRNKAISDGFERYKNAFHPDAVRDRWARVVRGEEVPFLPESHRPETDTVTSGETYTNLAEEDFSRYMEIALRYCTDEVELEEPYDMEGFAEYFNRPFSVSKPILEEYHHGRFTSPLSFSTRLSTYLDVHKHEEFGSIEESAKFFLLALMGRSNYFTLKDLLRK
jgi:glycosyltransferase involved in cell wall biosynthesis